MGSDMLKPANDLARRYEAYNSQVVEHSGSICYISDMETYDLLHLTKAGMELYGLTRPEEYLGKKCYQVIMGLEEPCPFCTNSRLKEGQEYRWERYNNNIGKWFDRTSSLIRLDGRPCHLEIGRDITARKAELSALSGRLTMEDVLFRCLHTLTREKDMDTAVNSFLEGVGGYYQADRAFIFEIDAASRCANNTFEWCAPGVTSHLGLLQCFPLERVQPWYGRLETDGVFAMADLEEEMDHTLPLYQDLKRVGVHSLLMASLLQEGQIVGMLGVDNPRKEQGNLTLLRSVSEFVQAEMERRQLLADLEYISYIDTLTGLRNRNQYTRILKDYDRRSPESLGVVCLNINGMKDINDTHGHSYGDHIILKTGGLMAEKLSGSLFRTGGDEFAALYENVPKEVLLQEVAALRKAFDEEEDCSAALGWAWSDDEANTQNLLWQANELLAAEKRAYYHTVLREGRSTGHTSFSGEVLKEIADGRFMAYYQPQVEIQTGSIIGAEALVRKKAEDGTLIPPNKYIPSYEKEGVISHVDLFMMQAACADLRQWMDQGYDLNISVNCSRVTLLEPHIVDILSAICADHGVPSSAITIEVTESVGKMDNEQLRELIATLKAAGFSISLDDFGSQYSNLAILAALDFDEVKFDRSLVSTLEENEKSRVVMESGLGLCRALRGTSSLAEGIETEGQLALLREYRCDYGQGYYFSRPVPPEEFRALLGRRLGRPDGV